MTTIDSSLRPNRYNLFKLRIVVTCRETIKIRKAITVILQVDIIGYRHRVSKKGLKEITHIFLINGNKSYFSS